MHRLFTSDRLRHWPAGLLALVAALVAVWARYRIFPHFSWNRDEPVYLWHMETLRTGRLTSSDGGHPELFLPWLSGRGEGVLFSQYTLGWPLVLLVADVVTGSPTAALGLGAALAVLGTYAFAWELLRDRSIAIGAAAVMIASPILPVEGGVHLSYLLTLGLGLLFGVGLLSGIRTHNMGRVIGAGVLLGWIFLTRPYDAILWGLAFGTYAIVVHRDRWRDLLKPFLSCAMAALPLVAMTLAYNRHVTGSLLQFPITVADPMDTFGFGRRRLMPGFPITDYTPSSGLRAIAKHAFFLPWFLAGSYLSVGVAAGGLWVGRRQRSTLAILLIGAVFPLGYFPFWGTQQSSEFTRVAGPVYYIPLFACLAVLIATAITRLRDRHPAGAIALVVTMVLATVPFAQSRLSLNHELSAPQEGWRTSVEPIEGPAIVFVADAADYLMFLNPFSSNGPGLDDDILYAVDDDPAMLDLIAEQPGRTAYVQQASAPQEDLGPKEDPAPFEVTLTPVEVRRARAFTLGLTAGDPGDAGLVAVEVRVGEQVIRASVPAGASLPRFRLAPMGASPADLGLPERGTLSVTVGYGDTEAGALREPRAGQEVQFRVVDGMVEVLLPTTKLERSRVGDTWQWRQRPTTSDLQVELNPAAGAP